MTGRRAGKALTLTEQARRAQLVGVTIELIAKYGYASCSLQRIADAAGITKAAVIYHFDSKNAVLRAAYDAVIEELTGFMGARIAAAPDPAAAVDAYVTSLIEHLAERPWHVRVIVEALSAGETIGVQDSPHSAARWKPLADLIDAAIAARQYASHVDSRSLAIIIGGGIDGIVAERMNDPEFDPGAAGASLLEMLHRTV